MVLLYKARFIGLVRITGKVMLGFLMRAVLLWPLLFTPFAMEGCVISQYSIYVKFDHV